MSAMPDITEITDVAVLEELQRGVVARIAQLQEQGREVLLARWEEDARRVGLALDDIVGARARKRGRRRSNGQQMGA